MSAPDIRNCYATTYDQNNFYNFLNEIAVTHDGGDTWSLVTIDGLEDNFIMDIAASSARTVHVIGWNSVLGGGNIFRSTDGGAVTMAHLFIRLPITTATVFQATA